MEQSEFAWSESLTASAMVTVPAGRIDESTATAFADSLAAAVDRAAGTGVKVLVIDLDGVEYMSSRGLRALAMAHKRAGDGGLRITLARPGGMMQEIFEISRYDKLFGIFATIDEAIAAVSAG